MQVHEILRIKGTVLYTVVPAQSLGNAVATMADLDVGSLVVMEHGTVMLASRHRDHACCPTSLCLTMKSKTPT